MAYQPAATRYRPQRFSEVTGQDVAVKIIQNGIRLGRVPSLYLINGPKGTGKTTLGRIIAKALNCEAAQALAAAGQPPEPCCACDICLAIAARTSDLVIEIDAASHNGVDDARMFTQLSAIKPPAGKNVIFLLDEAHMLSPQAQNALLVLFENPPPNFQPIICTTDPQKILPTIRSRASDIRVKPIRTEAIMANLSRIFSDAGQEVTQEVLRTVSQIGNGSLRDVQQIADQIISAASGLIVDEEFLENQIGIPTSRLYRNLAGAIDDAWTNGPVTWAESVNEWWSIGFALSDIFFIMIPTLMRDLSIAIRSKEQPPPVAYLTGIPHATFVDNVTFTTRDIDIMMESWEEQAKHFGVNGVLDKVALEMWFLKCWSVLQFERGTATGSLSALPQGFMPLCPPSSAGWRNT